MKISSTKICEQNNINGITVHASQERYTGNIVGSAKFPTVKNSQIFTCRYFQLYAMLTNVLNFLLHTCRFSANFLIGY